MLGQPMSMLIPRVRRLQAARRAARGRDGHRSRPDRHADAARARRRRQVRRVLRRRHRQPAAGRPRDDRQHVARVRLDLRDLPDRRRDAALPRVLRPPPEHVERVETYAKAQGLWHDADSEEPTYSETRRARPRRGRAVARRPQAPAGPRLADRGQGVVPDGARRLPARGRRVPTRRSRTSFPASDPTAPTTCDAQRPRPRRPAPATGGVQVAERASPHGAAHARRRHRDRARPRPRRDRGDHVVHEHVEPVRDDRRGAARAQRRRARAAVQAVGQDVARARLEGRDGVLRRGEPRRAARGARLPPRRLRLHDLHRQLGPAAGGGLRDRQRPRTSRSSRCSAATATSRAASTPT